ncbi:MULTISPECIES: SDR family NAD(P)-dependent oxidoreductase [Kordiimonas]|jgi:NAD(P)-dependent dehydrogenase (short-subunit alcohol dehydrogenase family)|uniref:SDR family NAD(P)-dependent oxidoreductase n=1 Tax=Kordiimonas TaxID=288021 RepID=UPI00257CA791|nr:SDR family oxidoreductase [Kordiimonas sp. UBA4487]
MTDLLQNPQELFDVSDKVAVITGATGAFGQVAAKTLAGAGCKLALAGGNLSMLEKLAAEITQIVGPGQVVTVQERPNDEASCERIVVAAETAFGGVDILVVASGVNDVDPIEDMSAERWQAVMDANVKGSWLMCKAVSQRFIAQKSGKVVLVSSARGKLGHPAGYSAYCPSKSAVDGIVRSLGCEWGKYGITVNALAPTVFRSPLTAWMFEDTEKARKVRDGMLARIPVGRLGEPEDLAGPLLFLTSPASNFHTGHVIYADGGYTAG